MLSFARGLVLGLGFLTDQHTKYMIKLEEDID